MKYIDRIFGWLLVIGSALHAYGSLKLYAPQTVTLVWSLSATLAGLLLAAIHLMRVNRPQDRTLAYVGFAGALCWIAIAFAFGVAISAPMDPRILYHVVVALVLAGFSARGMFYRASL
jgi:hypothetical protein